MVATCHIPIILLTARSSLTHKREGYDIGADSYVTKPFSSDLLISRVNNLLKSRLQLKEYYTRSLLLMPSELPADSQDDKFIKHLVEVVEKLMNEPDFDVNKLAQEFSFSRSVLYRKVKALTNFSLIEFIRTVRLNRAAQMLKTGHYRVSEAAFEVGFNDIKHFRQCFKDQFQVTPSKLIKSIKS
jgi:AraC-like DNA-binding protein